MNSIPKILEWCKEERDEAKRKSEAGLQKLGDGDTTAAQIDRTSQAIGRLNAFREVIAKLEDQEDNMEKTKLKAPAGKFRVVGVDLFDHSDYIQGDYGNLMEASHIATEKNAQRQTSTEDVYYVYDDEGKFIPVDTGSQSVEP